MHLTTSVTQTVSELSDELADSTIAAIGAASDEGRGILIGVPAGRTLVPVISAIEMKLQATPMALHHLTIVMMDDYLVEDGASRWVTPPSSAHYSCRRFGEDLRHKFNRAVGDLGGIRESNLWSPDPRDPADYDRRIVAAGGIDVFFVAVGSSDGHVAFNPPGSDLASRTRIIPLASSTRRDNLGTFPQFGSLDEVPSYGITVGLATIADARRIEMVAHGADKAPAVAQLLTAGDFDARMPATFVYGHPNAHIRLDRAAAPTG